MHFFFWFQNTCFQHVSKLLHHFLSLSLSLRPHVTREKAVSCLKSSNSFQTLFFLFAICGKFQQSVAFLLYLLRFKAIDGHFANSLRYLLRFCNSLWYLYCDLWQFCNNFKFFSLFWFFGQFTAFPLVTWGLLMRFIRICILLLLLLL